MGSKNRAKKVMNKLWKIAGNDHQIRVLADLKTLDFGVKIAGNRY
jgi:hypothetical protein